MLATAGAPAPAGTLHPLPPLGGRLEFRVEPLGGRFDGLDPPLGGRVKSPQLAGRGPANAPPPVAMRPALTTGPPPLLSPCAKPQHGVASAVAEYLNCARAASGSGGAAATGPLAPGPAHDLDGEPTS